MEENEEIIGTTGPGVDLLNNNLTQEEWNALCVVHRMTNRLNVGIRFDYSKSIDIRFENGSQIIDESVYLSKESDCNKKEYEAAQILIRKYEQEEYETAQKKAHLMHYELKAIFGEGITEFFTRIEKYGDKMAIEIIPTEPCFDEDYGGEYDDELDKLGEKYDVWVKMESGIYGK